MLSLIRWKRRAPASSRWRRTGAPPAPGWMHGVAVAAGASGCRRPLDPAHVLGRPALRVASTRPAGDPSISQLAARGHRPRRGDRSGDVAVGLVNCGFAAGVDLADGEVLHGLFVRLRWLGGERPVVVVVVVDACPCSIPVGRHDGDRRRVGVDRLVAAHRRQVRDERDATASATAPATARSRRRWSSLEENHVGQSRGTRVVTDDVRSDRHAKAVIRGRARGGDPRVV